MNSIEICRKPKPLQSLRLIRFFFANYKTDWHFGFVISITSVVDGHGYRICLPATILHPYPALTIQIYHVRRFFCHSFSAPLCHRQCVDNDRTVDTARVSPESRLFKATRILQDGRAVHEHDQFQELSEARVISLSQYITHIPFLRSYLHICWVI